MVNIGRKEPGTSAEKIAEHRQIRASQLAINYPYEGLYARAKLRPVCNLSTSLVSEKNYNDGGGSANFGGLAIDQQETPPPSSLNDAKSLNTNVRSPKILMCKGYSWVNGNIAITWAEVAAGDTLCSIVDDCYLILRKHNSVRSINRPAWVSGPHWLSEDGF
jgi:hypothetical protein